MKKPIVTAQRSKKMRSHELTPYLPSFEDQMSSVGFTTLTIKTYSEAVCHFGTWLSIHSIRPGDIKNDVFERFCAHRCTCSGYPRSTNLSRKYLRRVHRFLDFLVETKVIVRAEPAETLPSVAWDQIGFSDWLFNEQGLTQTTVSKYVRALSKILPQLGYDAGQYTASSIRRVVCEYAKRYKPVTAKDYTTSLRSYLKYLTIRGLCSSSLIAAVPTIAQWRLSALPRYISASEVQRVVQSCDTTQQVGLRDKAILLLLSQLGLRASDIVNLQLSDIDWQSATLLVRGKSRRVSRMPLPQEVGDAIIRYLEAGRTHHSTLTHLFLCVTAPYRALSSPSIVSGIVNCAIKRSGIEVPTFSGAHLLRHSAATAWLRKGVALDTISTLLRHGSADMTMHYAKVDISALSDLTVAWPGEAS